MSKIDLYFSSQAKALFQAYKAASVMDKSVVGENREVLLKEFLEKHLSGDVAIGLRGQVIDSNSSTSGEVDLVIYSPLAPKFGNLAFYFSENVLFAIEVKSKLSRRSLKKALDNITKIKKLHREYAPGSIARGALSKRIPCGVFAFETSLGISSTQRQINDYYSLNEIDKEDKIEWVCVLNSFFIVNNEGGTWVNLDEITKEEKPARKGLITISKSYHSLFPMLIDISDEITRLVAATPNLNKYITGKV